MKNTKSGSRKRGRFVVPSNPRKADLILSASKDMPTYCHTTRGLEVRVAQGHYVYEALPAGMTICNDQMIPVSMLLV